MKQYFINPTTRDLIVWDTEGQELQVIEQIKSIRVFGTKGGVIGQDYRRDGDEIGAPRNGDRPEIVRRKKGQRKCKSCGQLGHQARTCPQKSP